MSGDEKNSKKAVRVNRRLGPMSEPGPLGDADMPPLSPLLALSALGGVARPVSASDPSPIEMKYLPVELIAYSRWNTRHASSMNDDEFEILKADIARAGGNIQPVKVRRRDGAFGPDANGKVERYELVFGHRRHQACLQLELPVLAIVEDVSDRQLILEMLSENENRKSMSAWELGELFQRLLDAHDYTSQSALAEGLNRDEGDVSRALRVRGICQDILAAITTPTGFALHDADKLSKALKLDRAAVMQVAKDLVASGRKVTAKEFMRLIAKKPESKPKCPCDELGGSKTEGAKVLFAQEGRNIVVARRHDDGALTIRIDSSMGPEDQEIIESLVTSVAKTAQKP